MVMQELKDFTQFLAPEDVVVTETTIVFEIPFHCDVYLNGAVNAYMLFCISQADLGAPFPRA